VGADETEGEAARATAFRRNPGHAGVEGDAVTSREDGDDDGYRTNEGQ
jgi:hypothetical protein